MTSSPYVIGSALGLLNTFAFATASRGLGVTTAFESWVFSPIMFASAAAAARVLYGKEKP